MKLKTWNKNEINWNKTSKIFDEKTRLLIVVVATIQKIGNAILATFSCAFNMPFIVDELTAVIEKLISSAIVDFINTTLGKSINFLV